ncbi:hypothetical protein LCGC14_1615350 [marine sediment metagenome]|uniref:Putative regulatory protein FmdB zinc ribbon domain-containing protein n=1 Tax=marine sediment metagenome TaxID=412755 RepID=A0A0F9L749_9ZZZZ
MPIYEYDCTEHGKFDVLEPMRKVGTKVDEYTSPCPKCKTYCASIMSASSYRMAELFQVQDNKGNIVQSKQVVKDNPEFNDGAREQKAQPTGRVPAIVAHNGSVYYDRSVGYYNTN